MTHTIIMKNILKSKITTIVGLVILVGMAYTAVTKGFSISEAISGLVALGFIFSKDYNKTHSE